MSFVSGNQLQQRKWSQNIPCPWHPHLGRTGHTRWYIQVAVCEPPCREIVFRRVVSSTKRLWPTFSGEPGCDFHLNGMNQFQQLISSMASCNSRSQSFCKTHRVKFTIDQPVVKVQEHVKDIRGVFHFHLLNSSAPGDWCNDLTSVSLPDVTTLGQGFLTSSPALRSWHRHNRSCGEEFWPEVISQCWAYLGPVSQTSSVTSKFSPQINKANWVVIVHEQWQKRPQSTWLLQATGFVNLLTYLQLTV